MMGKHIHIAGYVMLTGKKIKRKNVKKLKT